MGGRGGSSGFSITSQLKAMKSKGQFPAAFSATNAAEILKGIDTVFEYPSEVAEAMASKDFHMEDRPHRTDSNRREIYISYGSRTFGTSYPVGKTAAETAAIKRGAEKFTLINQNKKYPFKKNK